MITISICMIVKNEEAVLSRCLDSVKDAADEIIIVDTGSTDETKKIAGEYTEKVFDFEWIDDFSAARNFAYSKASMEYQMWLDADDVLPAEEREKLIKLKSALQSNVDIVTMKYHTHFGPDGTPVFTSTRERLTRREKKYMWQDPVHECIPLVGNIFQSDIAVSHKKPPSETVSTRNLNIYEKLEVSGKPLTPRQQYYFARELKDHRHYAKSVYYFERFLEGDNGWGEDNIAACLNLGICYNALGDTDRVLPVLLRSFRYDAPRAEICCEIGYHFKRLKNYKTALGWFRIAAELNSPDFLGFIQRDYWGYIPNIESCVCCCLLQQYEEAKKFNDLAKIFKPNSVAVKQNEIYLSSL